MRLKKKTHVVCIEDEELRLLYLLYERVNGFGEGTPISVTIIEEWWTGKRHEFVPGMKRWLSYLSEHKLLGWKGWEDDKEDSYYVTGAGANYVRCVQRELLEEFDFTEILKEQKPDGGRPRNGLVELPPRQPNSNYLSLVLKSGRDLALQVASGVLVNFLHSAGG